MTAETWQSIEEDPVATYAQHTDFDPRYLEDIPAHCRGGLARWILLGILPGSFLRAVLSLEWDMAEQKADMLNAHRIDAYRAFMHHGCPEAARGDYRKLHSWKEAGGILGRADQEVSS